MQSFIEKLKSDTYFEKTIIMSYGIFFGYVMRGIIPTSLFVGKNWKRFFTDMKKQIYNWDTKTFYINGEIDKDVVDNFKMFMLDVKPDETIDIVIETYGGSFLCAQMLSDMILYHKGMTNAVVLNNAFSAGSLIALSCKKLYMHVNAHLSPVDVMQSNFFKTVQLSAIKTIIDNKSKDKIADDTFILADQAEKCKKLTQSLFDKLIVSRYDNATSEKIKEELFDGNKNIHATAFSYAQLKEIGVKVELITQKMISKAKHNCSCVEEKLIML